MTSLARRRHARHGDAVVASFVHDLSGAQGRGPRSSRSRRSCRDGRRTINHHSMKFFIEPL